MASVDLHQALNRALLHLLRPLARILLRNGISFAQFAEQAKRAYVEVAWNEFHIPGKAQTISRIATLTGLTRKEVQHLQSGNADDSALTPGKPHPQPPLHEWKEDLSSPLSIHGEGRGEVPRGNGEKSPVLASAKYNRAARVISAWISEPHYQNLDGQPLGLPFDGEPPSFSGLVKKFSGDITPRTILDELVHIGAVQEREDGRLELLTRAYIPDGDDSEKIAILGTDTADLIATIGHNLKATREQCYFQRKVCYDHLPREAMLELRSVIERKAQAALESMNEDLALHDRDRHPERGGSGRVRCGLGIYYFEHEINSDETD